MIYTTPVLQNVKVLEYRGLVTAKNVRAVNIIRDLFTSFRDIFGGRSESYQEIMEEMQNEVIREIKEEARRRGANAIIGFQLDFENIGSKGRSLVMAFAKGTAVVVDRNPANPG